MARDEKLAADRRKAEQDMMRDFIDPGPVGSPERAEWAERRKTWRQEERAFDEAAASVAPSDQQKETAEAPPEPQYPQSLDEVPEPSERESKQRQAEFKRRERAEQRANLRASRTGKLPPEERRRRAARAPSGYKPFAPEESQPKEEEELTAEQEQEGRRRRQTANARRRRGLSPSPDEPEAQQVDRQKQQPAEQNGGPDLQAIAEEVKQLLELQKSMDTKLEALLNRPNQATWS